MARRSIPVTAVLSLLLPFLVAGAASGEDGITVTSPNGGECWELASTYNITWESTGSTDSDVKIELYKGGVFNRTIVSSTTNDGSHPWYVSQPLGSDYMVKVTFMADSPVSDYSDAYFSITPPSPPEVITVTSPVGGEEWEAGTTHDITWVSDAGGDVKIELFINQYMDFPLVTTITPSTPNNGSFTWLVSLSGLPSDVARDCYVKVTSVSNDGLWGIGGLFTIGAGVLVTSPNDGEEWQGGTTHDITWVSDAGGDVKIELLNSFYAPVPLVGTITPSTPNDGSFTWLVSYASPIYWVTEWQVKVTSLSDDSICGYSRVFTIWGTVLVTSPNGWEVYTRGSTCDITWVSDGEGDVGIYLHDESAWPNPTVTTIAESTPNDGSFAWSIPSDQSCSSAFRVEVRDSRNSNSDYSDRHFAIWPPIALTSPSGGEAWVQGRSYDIRWSWWDTWVIGEGPVRIELYRGDSLDSTIAVQAIDNGVFTWNIPANQPPGDNYRVKISSETHPSVDHYSAYFTVAARNITVTSPNGGETWSSSAAHNITWFFNGAGDVKIELYKGGAYKGTVVWGAPNGGSYPWEIPSYMTPGNDYRVRVSGVLYSGVWDESDSDFSITGPDTLGPVVSGLASVPTNVRENVDLSLALVATADDSTKGDSKIAGAEYFIGADPGTGGGTAMSAADGSYDSPVEGLTATVDTYAWTAPGLRRIKVRARDEAGNWTSPVAHVDVEVVDGTPPSAPASLSAAQEPGLRLVAGEEWNTLGTLLPEEEEIVMDLGSVKTIGAAGMVAQLPLTCFPRDFSIEGSEDGSDWTPLARQTSFRLARGKFMWEWEPTGYRYLKVKAWGRLDTIDGRYYVRVPKVAAFRAADGNMVTATWPATADDGDDASSGPATAYRLKYSDSPITGANWGAATGVAGEPTPGVKGTSETCTFSVGELTTVYVGLKIADEVPNWSPLATAGPVSAGPTGFMNTAPADLTTLGTADAAPTFEFQIGPASRSCYISFSGCDGFPQSQTVGEDGEICKTLRFPLGPGRSSWTPSVFQWKAVKRLVHTSGLLYWRLEGTVPDFGRVYGPSRTIIFDCGEINNLHVSPSHILGSDEAVWPDKGVRPTVSWTDNTNGMPYFLIDVSRLESIPVADTANTMTLGARRISGTSYTVTVIEWGKVRRLATWFRTLTNPNPADGVLYWRVRALSADRTLSCASAVRTLVVDGGEWELDPPVDNGDGTWTFSWAHTGEGVVKYALEFSVDSDFNPGARNTVKVPFGYILGDSYTLNTTKVSRLRTMAASGVGTLRWRVRGVDADGKFVCYSEPYPAPWAP